MWSRADKNVHPTDGHPSIRRELVCPRTVRIARATATCKLPAPAPPREAAGSLLATSGRNIIVTMNVIHRQIPLLAALFLSGPNLHQLHAQQSQPETQTEADAPIRRDFNEAMEQSKPGEEHKRLHPFAGKFKVTSRSYMDTKQPKQEGGKSQTSTGTATNAWILDGRFVQMQVETTMNQQSFKGMGFIGYDKIRKEYVSIWMDNVGTGIARATGTYDEGKGQLVETGTFSCPVTGDTQKEFRAEWKIVDEDTITYTMYETGDDGQQTKTMEVEYERVMDT